MVLRRGRRAIDGVIRVSNSIDVADLLAISVPPSSALVSDEMD